MMTFTRVSILAVFAVLQSGIATAAEHKFYAGLLFGLADASLTEEDFSETAHQEGKEIFESRMDTQDSAFGAFVGWQATRWLAIEASLAQIGTVNYAYDAIETFPNSRFLRTFQYQTKLETNALTASAIVSVPIGERFALGVRAGGAHSDTKQDVYYSFNTVGMLSRGSFESRDSSSGNAVVVGANAQFHVSARISVRLDWLRFTDVGGSLDTRDFSGVHTVPSFDVDQLSLALLGRF